MTFFDLYFLTRTFLSTMDLSVTFFYWCWWYNSWAYCSTLLHMPLILRREYINCTFWIIIILFAESVCISMYVSPVEWLQWAVDGVHSAPVMEDRPVEHVWTYWAELCHKLESCNSTASIHQSQHQRNIDRSRFTAYEGLKWPLHSRTTQFIMHKRTCSCCIEGVGHKRK